MNPSFMAMQQAVTKSLFNMMLGIPHKPKNVKLDQTDTKLFTDQRDDNGFPRSDLIEMAEAEQKERNTRAYLDKLAAEVKAR